MKTNEEILKKIELLFKKNGIIDEELVLNLYEVKIQREQYLFGAEDWNNYDKFMQGFKIGFALRPK